MAGGGYLNVTGGGDTFLPRGCYFLAFPFGSHQELLAPSAEWDVCV